jgi:hypothetical protein
LQEVDYGWKPRKEGSLKRREIEEHAPLESGLKVVYKTESSAEACNN